MRQLHDPSNTSSDQYKQEQRKELQDTLTTLVFPRQCQQLIMESVAANPASSRVVALNACKSACAFCNNKYKTLFPAVNKAAIKGVLYDIFMGSRQVQRPIFHTTLMEAFRNYPSANLNIFGSKAKSLPTPQKIKQMLLMLLAAGILDFNVKKENTEITILATLKWDAEHDLFVFQNNDAWALIRNKSI
jgi:hypothetical protein